MQRSESINELAAALAKAQGEMRAAKKDSENPFFKSKYADLAAVFDAIRGPFSKHGLSIMQFARTNELGVEVETLLAHSSGQQVSETLAMPVNKKDAQALGSAITYACRYGLRAIAGVPSEDDDGNAAADQPGNKPERKAKPSLPAGPDVSSMKPEDEITGAMVDHLKACFSFKGYGASVKTWLAKHGFPELVKLDASQYLRILAQVESWPATKSSPALAG